MNFISQRVSQIIDILDGWNSLDDLDQKALINFMIAIVQSSSVVKFVIENSEDSELKLALSEIDEKLLRFKNKFSELFGIDLEQHGSYDLSDKVKSISKEIDLIDQRSDINLDQKRQLVSDLLLANGYDGVTDFRKELVRQTNYKYEFANAVVSFNFGNFYEFLKSTLTESDLNELKKIIKKIISSEDQDLYYQGLVELHEFINVPENFDKLRRKFNLDGIQEHTLINQNTGYRANLDFDDKLALVESYLDSVEDEYLDRSLIDFKSKIIRFFREAKKLKSIKEVTSQPKLDSPKKPISPARNYRSDQGFDGSVDRSSYTIGFEIEGLLVKKEVDPGIKKTGSEIANDFSKIISGIADNDSRIAMRTKYGLYTDQIGPSINPLLLFSLDEIQGIRDESPATPKIQELESFFKNNDPVFYGSNKDLVDKAIENLKLLTAEEIFFLDLFYLKKDLSKSHFLTVDELFDWRDDDLNYQQKLLNTLKNIAYKGGFYAKTLDMIRATEISIGEFAIDGSKDQYHHAIEYFRLVANDHNLRFKDRNVQINIGKFDNSKSQFNIYNEGSNQDLEIFIDQETLDNTKLIQKCLVQLVEQNPELARKGMGLIGYDFRVDRVKGFGRDHFGSKYTTTFDFAEATRYISAFPIHRSNTGKASSIRLSRIRSQESDAIFEVRLIGNNPHFPYFTEHKFDIHNLGYDIVEKFINILKREISSFKSKPLVESSRPDKTQDEETTKEPRVEKIKIRYDGSVDGISSIKPNPEATTGVPLNRRYAFRINKSLIFKG